MSAIRRFALEVSFQSEPSTASARGPMDLVQSDAIGFSETVHLLLPSPAGELMDTESCFPGRESTDSPPTSVKARLRTKKRKTEPLL